MRLPWTAAVALTLATAATALAADPPPGRLAASVGERVLVADPTGPALAAFDAGPVGWLFPAPGGLLYAPDLIGGRTTVLDLMQGVVAERFDGVSMPRFSAFTHRYFVAAPGELLVVSYPDRALISRIEVDVRSPWQVLFAPDDSVVLILDRGPEPGGAFLVGVDLITRQTAYRRPLDGDVRRMALAPKLGLLALADSAGSEVRLVDPASVATVAALPTGGAVRDVAVWEEVGIAAAVDLGAGRGALRAWQLKRTSAGLTVTRDRVLPLSAAGVGVAASPDSRFLAAAAADGALVVVTAQKLAPVVEHQLGGEARHLVWCDTGVEAPPMPEWSDERPPQLNIGSGSP